MPFVADELMIPLRQQVEILLAGKTMKKFCWLSHLQNGMEPCAGWPDRKPDQSSPSMIKIPGFLASPFAKTDFLSFILKLAWISVH